jgi:activator of HSP90 ATPase
MQTKDIKQEIIFPGTPRELYRAWLDAKIHGKIVNGKAVIDPTVGGKFSIWDGYLIGKIIELHPDIYKIVQEWRDDSTKWPEDYYSKITLEFSPHQHKQTKLVFTQTGIPEEYAKDIEKGWEDYYWKPMKDYFSR